MAGRDQSTVQTIAEVFKKFGKSVDEHHLNKAHDQYRTLCDHAKSLAKKDIKTHDYLMSFYEENGEDYPASLSDDQKQTCLPLYDFLCCAGTVFDLTKIWPTYVFLVEVYHKEKKKSKKPGPHTNKSGDFIPQILQGMKSSMESDAWRAAQTEYVELNQNERQMKNDPDLAREKELWVLNGDVAAQKFLDNIEYMDRALYITIKEALQKNMEGSETAWCQYGSLLHSSELLRRSEEQKARRYENEVDELRERCEELTRENEKKTQEIEELTTRLSEVASQRMSIGNPNIADLSDSNRPTKIGERFSELYDNEWTQLYETLESEIENETERISKLCECLRMAFVFCKEKSELQLEDLQILTTDVLSFRRTHEEEGTNKQKDVQMKKETLCHLLEIRKQCSFMSLPNICQMFKESYTFTESNSDVILKDFDAYLNGCVETCWLMCIQDPPMVLVTPEEGEEVVTQQFEMYKTKGETVDTCVWPALLLCENGGVVCKGYVLPK